MGCGGQRHRGRFSPAGERPDGAFGILLGASPAFGLGASADRHTLASQLSEQRGAIPWLNLAAPALNSTQETILYALNRHRLAGAREIAAFSGLNNLVVAGLPAAEWDYGQFFFSGEFFRQPGVPDPGETGAAPAWSRGRLAGAARRLVGQAAQEPPVDRAAAARRRIEIAAGQAVRDVELLADLGAAANARVHYVLQPTAAWTGKLLTDEERALIDENYEQRPQMWRLFEPVLTRDVHEEYAGRLEEACAKRGISFLDANAALRDSSASDQWLFVDQVHLTDLGTG